MRPSKTVKLTSVLADLIGSARALVDQEIRSMEAAVMQLERAERSAAMNRWPEGERWRELANDDFVRLKISLDQLFSGDIAHKQNGSKIVKLRK